MVVGLITVVLEAISFSVYDSVTISDCCSCCLVEEVTVSFTVELGLPLATEGFELGLAVPA